MERNMSFSGCGFLGIYHVGVAAAMKQYAPHFAGGRIAGASAGAIAAACYVCDCCLGQGTSDVLRIVVQARSTALGPMHPSFRLVKIIKEGLRNILPMNAHEMASGRLFISLTRFSDGRNVLVSQFDSREELIQAIVCSCFIPFYCGTVPPTLKGERYIDGGWSDNLPVLDGATVTVSPFSGETDICPQDADSASFFAASVSGSSVRLTARNLYRLSVALFPPHPEILSQMCRQGFEDALRWLTNNGMINCTRCLEIRSSITLPKEHEMAPEPAAEEPRGRHGPAGSCQRVHVRSRGLTTTTDVSECEGCLATLDLAPAKGLPPQVRRTLAKAESDERDGWLNWVMAMRPVKWLRYALIPWSLPVDLTYQICLRVLEWLPQLPSDAAWLVERLTSVIHFVMKEIDATGHLYSARFTCQLAVTELNISERSASFVGAQDEAEERTEMDYGFCVALRPSRQGPMRQLTSMLGDRATLSNPNVVGAAGELERAGVRSFAADEEPDVNDTDLDSVAAIIDFSHRHDALVSFYYEDQDRTIKVHEIFGMDAGDGDRVHDAISRGVSRRQSFVRTVDHRDDAAPPPPDPAHLEGLVINRIHHDLPGHSSRRDAGCSPIRTSEGAEGRKLRGRPAHQRPSPPTVKVTRPRVLSASESEEGESLFVPTSRRQRTLSDETRAYDAATSSEEGD